MLNTIPDFSTTRILVVGDVMLDRYWSGTTSRISPEAPVPVVKIGEQTFRAGGAGNVAFNIASLGCHVVILGLVGEDDAAVCLRNCLTHEKITSHLIKVPGWQTITKLRVISQNQQLIRLDFETPVNDDNFSELEERYLHELDKVDCIVLSDYAKGTLSNAQWFIRQAKNRGVPVIVDPKSKNFKTYSGATILTPNLAELEAVVGYCIDDNTLISNARALCHDLELEAILVTRGDRGLILITTEAEAINFPAKVKEMCDVTGAGDTVVAVLACFLATNRSLSEALVLANKAARIVIGKMGTASVTLDELYSEHLSIKKIISEDELLEFVQKSKLVGERVVMTNGCFDMMHAGHLTYLSQARSLGDKLIVAVNDDELVCALKGQDRPVNSLKERMLMLSSLGCVDWVVSFSELTPDRLICRVSPDFLVKGGDYSEANIVGADYVKSNGGEVRVLDSLDGYSTTSLIKKIQNNTNIREEL